MENDQQEERRVEERRRRNQDDRKNQVPTCGQSQSVSKGEIACL